MRKLKELLVEALSKTEIFEMAYERSEYVKALFNLRIQLIENWCLLRYSTIMGRLQTHSHWMKEMRAHMNNLINMKIKVDKTRATRELLIDKEEADDFDHVIRLISNKWQDEHFDIESKETEEVVRDFIEYGLYDLIEIIGKKKVSLNELNDYLNGI